MIRSLGKASCTPWHECLHQWPLHDATKQTHMRSVWENTSLHSATSDFHRHHRCMHSGPTPPRGSSDCTVPTISKTYSSDQHTMYSASTCRPQNSKGQHCWEPQLRIQEPGYSRNGFPWGTSFPSSPKQCPNYHRCLHVGPQAVTGRGGETLCSIHDCQGTERLKR